LQAIEKEEKCAKILLRTSKGQRRCGQQDVDENINVNVDLEVIREEGLEFSNPYLS